MTTIDYLDVMVVYSSGVAQSASISNSLSKHPFLLQSRQSNYNLSYAYFLETCRNNGIKAGFAVSSDIIGPGSCSCYWVYASGSWIKIDHHAKSHHIFDKISPISTLRLAERQLLFSDTSVVPFNDAELFDTFFDKLTTFKRHREFAIPTIALNSSTTKEIDRSIGKLKLMSNNCSRDITHQIILKDRFGSGGNNVFRFDQDYAQNIRSQMLKHPTIKFIIQPFLLFDKGYSYSNIQTAADIRLIFLHDKLLQCYIRIAKADEFRCNEHQGGELRYISNADIPQPIRKLSKKLVRCISKPGSLYALDFVMSNSSTPYFIEGNTGPGLDWDVSKIQNERKSKQLINSIIGEFKSRLAASSTHVSSLVTAQPLAGSDIFAAST